MSSKYIILQTPAGEKVVIFPGDDFYHDDVAMHFDSLDVVSAGFVHLGTDNSIECYGKSTGLNLESRGEDDAVVIHHQLRRDKK
jgi:hypothetical protein